MTAVISTYFCCPFSKARRQLLHKQVSGSVDTGEKLGRSVEVLASSGVLREFTVATEVTPLALHWTMCMAATAAHVSEIRLIKEVF